MIKTYPLKSFFIYGVVATILYLIPAIIFIKKETFAAVWLLYLGNALFLVSVLAFMLIYQKPSDKNSAKLFMLTSGLIVTAMGVILSVVLITIIIFIIKPSFFPISVQKNITHAPSNTNGLGLSLYIDVIIGNIIAGAFPAVMASFLSRSYYKQTPER